LVVTVVLLVSVRLVGRRIPSHADTLTVRADVPGWNATAPRLKAAVEDSEWLAALSGNPPPNPTVQLQDAIRINPLAYRESAKNIREGLGLGRVVILDFAGTDEETAARLVDFCSAMTLASGGVLQQLSSTVLILTPQVD
jgi:hypothetical protein